MHNKSETIRWLLVLPSAILGWYLALIIGLLAHSAVEALCPPQEMDSVCIAPWYSAAVDTVIIFGASLAAILIILFPVSLAPKKRKLVAKIIYIGGVLFAAYAVYETSAWGAFIGAVVSGAIFLFYVLRFLEGKQSA